MFSLIDEKKAIIENKRPLPTYTLKSLREKLLLEWTYNSNAIEGNTLTLIETKVVLEGITIGGKTLREHLEVINHQEAITYVEDIIKKEEPLTQWQIKNIHRIILKGINDNYAGVYRDQQVLISGASHTPPPHYLLEEKMEELLTWYNTTATTLHPIVRSAMLHAIFVAVHPFIDGNGRTARLLLNFELMKNGYPPIVIDVNNRIAYYNALDKSIANNDYTDFIALISKALDNSLDLYLSVL